MYISHMWALAKVHRKCEMCMLKIYIWSSSFLHPNRCTFKFHFPKTFVKSSPLYLCLHTQRHTHTEPCTQTCTHTHTCPHTQTHARTHRCTSTCTRRHTRAHLGSWRKPSTGLRGAHRVCLLVSPSSPAGQGAVLSSVAKEATWLLVEQSQPGSVSSGHWKMDTWAFSK